MALNYEGTSSSNSSFHSHPPWKFHVFLSFRGADTRKTFTDFLYTTLQRKGIITFRDDEQLERGEVISEQLLKAIEESLFAIVVLSPKYASSTWCLDELQKILESRKGLGREVFPVFYDVDRSDVRHQKGSFGDAFRKHEERFREDRDKVKRWRDALTEVAGFTGWDSQKRHHSHLIEEIVNEVWRKLQVKLPSFNDGLVGIDSKMEDMFSLLGRGSEDVRFIGIWGMGGIGKTTLARVVYERIHNEFEVSCFLANVREISDKSSYGLVQLQRELLSHLKIRGMEIKDSYQGKKTIRNLLCNKKVLLVLDDASANNQLENLAGNQEWFGRGSRIMITARDRHLLTAHGVYEQYEIQILNNDESLQLFCQKAFKDQPQQCYLELSKNVVHYAGGLPLALKVLGSFLCGRSVPEWENALDKIRKVPHKDIIGTLRLSYEALDDVEKNIFLNIACFFKGMEKHKVTHILEICDLYPTIGINVLLEKSLISEYYEHGIGECHVGMHDMLQEMGKNIIIEESLNDVGKRSRLWLQEDIDHVLTKNNGTEVIQGIILESRRSYVARWDPKAFSRMCNVKILMLQDLYLPLGVNCLPEGLKYLEWEYFPLKELPLIVQLDELVELTMHYSKIKQLWHGTEFFGKLKLIDLKDSKDLIRFPSVSGVPCLNRLVLENCINLVEVHQSVGLHRKFMVLNLRNCVNLKILPSKLEMDSLEEFLLSHCSKLKKLPEFGDNMVNLSKLDLEDCKNLVCLPKSIHNLKSLRILKTSGCSKFSRLPENLDKFEDLEELNVSGTAIKEVPPSIVHLKYLKKLSLGGARETESNWWSLSLPFQWKFWRHPFSTGMMLPPLSPFPLLKELNLSYCNISDESFPFDLGSLSSLMSLDLSGNNFIKLPTSCIANLSELCELKLDFCPRLESVPTLPPNIVGLYGRNCTSLELFSDPKYLCDLFATHSYQKAVSGLDGPYLFIPGSEIPPWFINQNYFHHEFDSSPNWESLHEIDYTGRENLLCYCDSMISIIVEIPDYCLSSEWWGIAVCLVLENQFPPSSWCFSRLDWICKTPGEELPFPSGNFTSCHIQEFNDPHLCILLLRGNYRNIQRHLKGDHNRLQLLFVVQVFFIHSDNGFVKLLKIRKCGCRVICKEDLEVWDKAVSEGKQSNSFEMPSSNLNKTREREIVDEWASTSNAEAKRRKLG